MTLRSLEYIEFDQTPRRWQLKPMEFEQINLVVGKNATGKSRIVNVISGICKIISGKTRLPFSSGTYKVELELNDGIFCYELACQRKEVEYERLLVNDITVLERDVTGSGTIWYDAKKEFIDFEMERSAFALTSKQDRLQHPFSTAMADWAKETLHLEFGSDFGRTELISVDQVEVGLQQQQPGKSTSNSLAAYIKGFAEFGEAFDSAVVRNMRSLGYRISRVDAKELGPEHLTLPHSAPKLLNLEALDEELNLSIPQILMSQGMYRALALVIHLTLARFRAKQTLVLIDDIGEGLDFERSSQLIRLAVQQAEKSDLQLIMTSNDRFVMNNVPIEYWAVLERHGSTVKAFTKRNSPDAFENFKFLGLSNFDFFAAKQYQ